MTIQSHVCFAVPGDLVNVPVLNSKPCDESEFWLDRFYKIKKINWSDAQAILITQEGLELTYPLMAYLDLKSEEKHEFAKNIGAGQYISFMGKNVQVQKITDNKNETLTFLLSNTQKITLYRNSRVTIQKNPGLPGVSQEVFNVLELSRVHSSDIQIHHLIHVFDAYRQNSIGGEPSNPYSPGSARASSWNMGWDLAERDKVLPEAYSNDDNNHDVVDNKQHSVEIIFDDDTKLSCYDVETLETTEDGQLIVHMNDSRVCVADGRWKRYTETF